MKTIIKGLAILAAVVLGGWLLSFFIKLVYILVPLAVVLVVAYFVYRYLKIKKVI